MLTPPLFSRDGWSYAAQGKLAHLGISPYGPVPLLFGDLAATQTGNPWVLVVGRRLATMTGATMLLGPVVHLWYLLWVLPFVAVLKLSRLALAGVLALSTVTGLLAPLDSTLHGAYLAIALASMLVACLVPVLLLTPRARLRIERIVTAEWLPDQAAGRSGDGSGGQPQQPAGHLGMHVEHPLDRA